MALISGLGVRVRRFSSIRTAFSLRFFLALLMLACSIACGITCAADFYVTRNHDPTIDSRSAANVVGGHGTNVAALESGVAIVLISIMRNGSDIEVIFEALQGTAYRLERKLALTDSSWQSIPGVNDLIAASNGPAQITDPGAVNLGKAFYRVNFPTTLTVTKNGNGTGTVTSSPAGINCGADCAETYDSGIVVTLTATASAGSTFSGWGDACLGTGTCIVTMDAAKSVSANFIIIPVDADGDGYYSVASGGNDCDDTNPNVHPGATEVCNGIDDDCDAAIDEGFIQIWYRDADGDTYGNLLVTVQAPACSQPTGYVSNNTDCDDSDARAHPGQMMFFTTPRNSGGFDFNCDTVETRQFPNIGNCANTHGTCFLTPGWVSSIPACGQAASQVIQCNPPSPCSQVNAVRVQPCR